MSFKLKFSTAQEAQEKLVAGIFSCLFGNEAFSHRQQCLPEYLISSNYKADPESALPRLPQTDNFLQE